MKKPAEKHRKLPFNRNGIVLMLSMLLAAASVYFAKSYIESQINYYRDQLNRTEPMVKVVVPNRSLQRGEMINASLLSVRDIPSKYADSNSVTGASFNTAVGQRLSYDLDEGRPLLWAHLDGGVSTTFSGKVPSGLRAMTVRVDEINSISGFLQPGDRIDFLMTHKVAGTEQIFPLIQNLPIIATGLQTLVDQSPADGGRAFSTITVKVTPDEAKKLGLSQQVGKLTATLRNPEDKADLSFEPLSVAQLFHSEPATPVPSRVVAKGKLRVKRPRIEYIIGGL